MSVLVLKQKSFCPFFSRTRYKVGYYSTSSHGTSLNDYTVKTHAQVWKVEFGLNMPLFLSSVRTDNSADITIDPKSKFSNGILKAKIMGGNPKT